MNTPSTFNYAGFNIIVSNVLPDKVPTIELSYKVNVSAKFRKECNELYIKLYGYKTNVLIMGNDMIVSNKTFLKLKSELTKQVM